MPPAPQLGGIRRLCFDLVTRACALTNAAGCCKWCSSFASPRACGPHSSRPRECATPRHAPAVGRLEPPRRTCRSDASCAVRRVAAPCPPLPARKIETRRELLGMGGRERWSTGAHVARAGPGAPGPHPGPRFTGAPGRFWFKRQATAGCMGCLQCSPAARSISASHLSCGPSLPACPTLPRDHDHDLAHDHPARQRHGRPRLPRAVPHRARRAQSWCVARGLPTARAQPQSGAGGSGPADCADRQRHKRTSRSCTPARPSSATPS